MATYDDAAVTYDSATTTYDQGVGFTPQTLTPATETDTPVALVRVRARTLTPATETDTAVALSRARFRTLTPATEADVAVALVRVRRRTLTPATETDVAVALVLTTFGQTLNPAVETDTPVALVRVRWRTLTPATETDVAVALVRLTEPTPDYPDARVVIAVVRIRTTVAAHILHATTTTPPTRVSVTMPNDPEPMYVGDLLPQLRIDATSDGVAVDFTTAATCVINARIGDQVIITARAVTTKGNGFVLMTWQTADTDTAGYLELEVVATWAGLPQTFRARAGVNILPRIV